MASSTKSTVLAGNPPKYDHLVKLLLIGDSGVGKSCILLRYCENDFAESFITTIGIDFKVRTLMLDGKKVRLQIWDTAGQERFQTILPAYYRGADGIALVYDVTDAQTFGNVSKWIKQIETHAPDRVQKVLIGNKADMSSERVITTEQGQELGKTYDAPFFECSAKAGVNITPAFETLISNVITKAPPKPVKDPKLVLGGGDGNGGGEGGKGDKCSAASCAK